MDKSTYERIHNIMGNVPLADLEAWVKQVAPGLKTSEQRAHDQNMNAFLNNMFGREYPNESGTPIPRPDTNSGVGYDAWMLFYDLKMEDFADYIAEKKVHLRQQRAAEAEQMQMSNMLRALRDDEYAQDAAAIQELIDNSNRLNADKRTMNDILQSL